jgi:hypothetical protein
LAKPYSQDPPARIVRAAQDDPEAAEQLRVASILSFTAAGRIRHVFRDLHLVHDWLTFDAKAG